MAEEQLRTFEGPTEMGDLKFTVWDRDGEPWFVAKETLAALGMDLTNGGPARYMKHLDQTEKTKVTRKELPQLFRGSHAPSYLMISEAGLYKLIMRSNKPEAIQFQDWVTKVVLPAIRKDGAYVQGEEKVASGELSEDEFILKAVQILQNKVDRLTTENRKLSKELTQVTIAEYIALNHQYVSRHDKSRIAFAAVDLAARRGITLEKQQRQIKSALKGLTRAINVYPRDLLDEVVRSLEIFEPKAVY